MTKVRFDKKHATSHQLVAYRDRLEEECELVTGEQYDEIYSADKSELRAAPESANKYLIKTGKWIQKFIEEK